MNKTTNGLEMLFLSDYELQYAELSSATDWAITGLKMACDAVSPDAFIAGGNVDDNNAPLNLHGIGQLLMSEWQNTFSAQVLPEDLSFDTVFANRAASPDVSDLVQTIRNLHSLAAPFSNGTDEVEQVMFWFEQLAYAIVARDIESVYDLGHAAAKLAASRID